jgi:hypothetical protein
MCEKCHPKYVKNPPSPRNCHVENIIQNSAKIATPSFSTGKKYNIELVFFGLEIIHSNKPTLGISYGNSRPLGG